MDLLTEYVIPHWPLWTIALSLAIVGQVLKGSLFSRKFAEKYVIFWWGRKTMPMHPILVGMLVGFVPGIPVGPGIESGSSRVLYFMAAGLLSTWGFDFLKSIAVKKGVKLREPVDADEEESRYPGLE
jgi:hypothetical protein